MDQRTLTSLMGVVLAIIAPATLAAWTPPLSDGATPGLSFGDAGAGAEAFRVVQLDQGGPAILQANLPPDTHVAEQLLDTKYAQIQESDEVLARAQARIGVVSSVIASQEAGQAFDPNAPQSLLGSPEQELLAALAAIEGPDGQVQFGLGDELGEKWEQISAQIKTTLDSLLHQVVYNAWVETRVENKTVGRTVVAWTGSTETDLLAAITSDEIGLHGRSVDVALISRQKLVRLLFLALDGALKLSLLLSAPGSVILALPAIWKYVNQVLDELVRNQSTHQTV
ncbi:MAG: hypothetical protein HY326_06720 [Chloroflexi bacterium]|nr:hypothetical protein [Chloroflexota bacterium]